MYPYPSHVLCIFPLYLKFPSSALGPLAVLKTAYVSEMHGKEQEQGSVIPQV